MRATVLETVLATQRLPSYQTSAVGSAPVVVTAPTTLFAPGSILAMLSAPTREGPPSSDRTLITTAVAARTIATTVTAAVRMTGQPIRRAFAAPAPLGEKAVLGVGISPEEGCGR
jgi:hypothetical protein